MNEKVEPECDEEQEINEKDTVKTMLSELELKMADTNKQLENAEELPHYTRVIDEQNRQSIMLLELFSRAYTLYCEMILQEFEGYYK